MSSIADDTLRCPTCRASQPWSDSCRRCKCDLRLLREASEAYRAARSRALAAVRAGEPLRAVEWARRAARIAPEASACELLAACLLLAERWAEAQAAARQIVDSRKSSAGRGTSDEM